MGSQPVQQELPPDLTRSATSPYFSSTLSFSSTPILLSSVRLVDPEAGNAIGIAGISTADAIYLALDDFSFQSCQWQRQEESDPPIQNREGFKKGALNLFRCSFHLCGVGNSPPSRQGVSRPNRTHFTCGPVAYCKNKLHLRCIGLGEL